MQAAALQHAPSSPPRPLRCTPQVSAGSEEARKPLHGPNQWPSEQLVPNYRARTTAYFAAVKGLAERCGAIP
jgi:isopenicillin N synthase-like dioxygenase